MLARVAPILILVPLALAACGDDSSAPQATARPMTRGPALQLFLREAYSEGLFREGDPVDVSVEEMLYDDAARLARELGLGLYATAPGDPPCPDGLPGFFITVEGDFIDSSAGDGEETRRPAVAAAFVDLQGRFTYVWRFVQ